ncbi:MAG: isoprenylcysteine carboxylmethyltransferase family protein [Burkholderiales bacterium]
MGLSPRSALLVSLQFILIGLILWPFGAQRFRTIFWIGVVASIALGIYTLLYNRLGNFNIRPEPKASGRLITSGPYRLIRHPMYSALMLAMAAFVAAEQSALKLGLWIALGLTLLSKAGFEEQLMSEKFPNYQDYRERSKRFIPYIF